MRRITRAFTCVALAFLTFSATSVSLFADQDSSARTQVPSEEAQAKATSLIKNIFKADYADHSSAARGRLASKLQQQADQTSDDQTARFVLLRESRDAFAHDGAVRDAVRVSRQMEAEFDVRGAEAQVSAVVAAHGTVRTSEAAVDLANAALGVAEAALRENNAQGAEKAIREAESVPLHKNSPLAARVQAASKRVRAAEQSAEALDTAIRKLKSAPDDPNANFTAGRILCFEQDHWDTGLPLLQRGSDALLAPILHEELQKPAEAAGVLALADAWWQLPENTGISKAQSRQRAASWYRRALDGTTGLRRMELERRIAEANKHAAPSTLDLLALVDPAKDAVSGSWKTNEEGLVGGPGDLTRIELPYEPPEEYDFRVTFARTSGDSIVIQICRSGEDGFFWEGASHEFLLGFVEGPKAANQHLIFPDAAVKNSHKCTSVVSVRKDRVSVFVDDKPIGSFQRSEYQMRGQDGWTLIHPARLGVGVHQSTVIFYDIEVTEISGHGRILP